MYILSGYLHMYMWPSSCEAVYLLPVEPTGNRTLSQSQVVRSDRCCARYVVSFFLFAILFTESAGHNRLGWLIATTLGSRHYHYQSANCARCQRIRLLQFTHNGGLAIHNWSLTM
uniref:GM07526p n=1 Tax=Drosophila melanogaster TaxID=7227 RepID=Q95S69_DROME|nr:GM07526p [Drosophila melanogaster]